MKKEFATLETYESIRSLPADERKQAEDALCFSINNRWMRVGVKMITFRHRGKLDASFELVDGASDDLNTGAVNPANDVFQAAFLRDLGNFIEGYEPAKVNEVGT